MHLLAGRKPAVLIVDHGLRKNSAKEARAVARHAEAAGLKAHILTWRGAKPKSNIEGRAREARYRLLGDWCLANGVGALFVAHTMDDLAETFLLRLARGSGVDGLSAMQTRGAFPLPGYRGVELVRPLLDVTRGELRAYLKARGLTWIEDPMNTDPRFARARMRALWPTLEAAGLTRERIAAAARHLARARSALETQTRAFLDAHAHSTGVAVLIDAGALKKAPKEIGLRTLAALLQLVSGQNYRPRFERLESLYDTVRAGATARTLHGCRVGPAPKRLQEFGSGTWMIAREVKNRSTGKAEKNRQRSIKAFDVAPGEAADVAADLFARH
jgi:tRNA(Ile)-lysidine synthase